MAEWNDCPWVTCPECRHMWKVQTAEERRNYTGILMDDCPNCGALLRLIRQEVRWCWRTETGYVFSDDETYRCPHCAKDFHWPHSRKPLRTGMMIICPECKEYIRCNGWAGGRPTWVRV